MKVIVSGLSDAMRILISASNDHPRKLKQQVKESLRTILNNAKRKVPKGIGADLAKSGGVDYPNETTGSVSFSNFYAPYVEFGTGPAASKYVPSLPPEWQEVAKRKFINGLGRTGEKKYLYPAVQDGLPEMIKKMKENA